MTETTCPFCNAVVAVPERLAAGKRLTCTRCGESFVYRPSESSPSPAGTAEPDVRAPALGTHDQSFLPSHHSGVQAGRISNRAVAAAVLGVMVLMAFVSLVIALQTTAARREHDRQIVKPQEIRVPLAIKIASNLWIIGLGYVLYRVWKERDPRRGDAEASPRLGWAVGVVAVIAIISITVSLVSGPIRKRSTQLDTPESTPVRAVAPASLEALGYLPVDTNVILAVHVDHSLLEGGDKEGMPPRMDLLLALLLGRLRQFAVAADDNDSWGLKWDDIDHIVLGVKVADLLPPRLVLVIRTRDRYDAEAIRKALKATALAEAGAKERYRFKVGKPALEAILWFKDDKTLLAGLSPQDLDMVPATPRTGIAHLPLPLQTMIQDRVDRGASAWLAAHAERWQRTFLQTWMLTLPKREHDVLTNLHTVGMWLTFPSSKEGDIVLGAAAECADEFDARQAQTYVEDWSRPRWPDAKFFQEGAWLTGQARGSADTIRQGLAPGGK